MVGKGGLLFSLNSYWLGPRIFLLDYLFLCLYSSLLLFSFLWFLYEIYMKLLYEAHIDKSCEVLVWEVSEKFGIEGRGQQSNAPAKPAVGCLGSLSLIPATTIILPTWNTTAISSHPTNVQWVPHGLALCYLRAQPWRQGRFCPSDRVSPWNPMKSRVGQIRSKTRS